MQHIEDYPEKCRVCRGCVDCEEANCLFHRPGQMDTCHPEKCHYCKQFIERGRLFLNNVG